MRRICASAVVFLAGCMTPPSSPPDATTTIVVEPDAPSSVPASEGNCLDGVDADLDGRVDCEDADCVDSTGCIEVCANGEDDDNNGLVDEEDAACWTPESTDAPRVTSRVHWGGAARFARSTMSVTSANLSVGFFDWDRRRSWKGSIDSAFGTAQVTTAASGTHQCTWWATGIEFGYLFSSVGVRRSSASTISTYTKGPVAISRMGSGVDSACPVSVGEVLPRNLENSAWGHFGVVESSVVWGRRWYVFHLPLFPDTARSGRWTSSRGFLRREFDFSSANGVVVAGEAVLMEAP